MMNLDSQQQESYCLLRVCIRCCLTRWKFHLGMISNFFTSMFLNNLWRKVTVTIAHAHNKLASLLNVHATAFKSQDDRKLKMAADSSLRSTLEVHYRSPCQLFDMSIHPHKHKPFYFLLHFCLYNSQCVSSL